VWLKTVHDWRKIAIALVETEKGEVKAQACDKLLFTSTTKIPVPLALHYIENSALLVICCRLSFLQLRCHADSIPSSLTI
jgi:hypothetical protein